jgi:hypothetical protein
MKEKRRAGRRPNTMDEPLDPAADRRFKDAISPKPWKEHRNRKSDNQPRPANMETPPVLRRSTRNRNPVKRYGAVATAHAIFMSGIARTPHAMAIDTQPVHPVPFHHYNQNEHLSNLTGVEYASDQFKYVQSLDICSENTDDPDDHIWDPIFVYGHRVTKRRGQRKNLVKVGWKVGDPTWVDLEAVRAQKPFILLDYVARKRLANHPDWKWVSEYTKRPETVQTMAHAFAAQTRNNEPRIKFGIEVPTSVKQAMELDKKNGNNLWKEAIQKELKQINDFNTFRIPGKGEVLREYTRIPYHMVFDVKFDLRRKARLVAGGNHTAPTKEDIYSGVVDLMSVRLGFLLASLNGLDVCAADIGNAFLYGKSREKAYVIAGREFGELAGKPLIIDKGLYGLRSSSARFHEHLSAKLRSMGYRPSKADSDFWIKDCGTHYEYIATYVDDVLAFGKNPMATIDELKNDYILKGVGRPEYYLGGNVFELDMAWAKYGVSTATSAKTYIENVVKKYETMLKEEFKKCKTPMDQGYHPELDESDLLDPKQVTLFRGLVGSANWAITLGRYDVHYATNALSRFSMMPRVGHLTAMKRIFGYLKQYPDAKIIIDPKPMEFPTGTFMEHNWMEFYPDAEEELPPDMPEPKGNPVTTTCYVDADHAHDMVTRRSVTGAFFMVNSTPIKWISKRQKTIETSTYGSELVAARIAIETIIEIRYKLRMLGVPIKGPTAMFGDNMSVVINTTVPSSQLKKKHNAIAYHRVREAIAAKIVQLAHIPSKDNIADLLTKPLSNDSFQRLMRIYLYRKPPNWDKDVVSNCPEKPPNPHN